MFGIIDSGADITIIVSALFRKVATVACLKKDLQKPDRTPHTWMDTWTLTSPLGIKPCALWCTSKWTRMISCCWCVDRQLDILLYHPDVQVWRGGKKKQWSSETEVQVPTVTVHPVQKVQVPPQQHALVEVWVDCPDVGDQAVYLEPNPHLESKTGLVLEDALLQPDQDGFAQTMITNPLAVPCEVHYSTPLGEGSVVALEDYTSIQERQSSTLVRKSM